MGFYLVHVQCVLHQWCWNPTGVQAYCQAMHLVLYKRKTKHKHKSITSYMYSVGIVILKTGHRGGKATR